MEDVRFSLASDDFRPVISAERLNLDNVKFPRVPGVTQPMVTTNIGKLIESP